MSIDQMPSRLYVNPDSSDLYAHGHTHITSPDIVFAELKDALEACQNGSLLVSSLGFHWQMNVHREMYSSVCALRESRACLVNVRDSIDEITMEWWKWIAGVKELSDWDRFFFSFIEHCKRIDDFIAHVNRLYLRINALRNSVLN